jgi:signal recognition particle GTPase
MNEGTMSVWMAAEWLLLLGSYYYFLETNKLLALNKTAIMMVGLQGTSKTV